MKIFGIQFVPITTPIKSHLEVLSAGIVLFLLVGLLPFGVIFTIYLLFFTKYWYLVAFYLFWIWFVDRDIPENGGRINEWVRSWSVFKYARNYFPITIKAVPGFKMDPYRNYMSCGFPHGIMPFGVIIAVLTNAIDEVKTLFPHHVMLGTTLKCNFLVPLYREFLLGIGMCSTSPKSIEWNLNYPGGGKMLGIIVGGAAEALYGQPGQYRLVLKNRKGFIKLALRNGSSIIPSFAFGQNDSYKQLVFPHGSISRNIQEWVKRLTGAAPVLINGRGLLQYTFGFIPLQKPINIVLGHPIEVNKIKEPTQEDIDCLHQTFIEKLTELFEEYKYEYEKDPEKSTLTIS